jgi:hypothetical protein
MRILGWAIVTFGGLALACQAPPTATEDAGPASLGRANENGATFWSPDGSLPCAVIDGIGGLVPQPCTMQVATPSSNSNAMVVVRASGIFNPTGTTVTWGPENPGYAWRWVWSQAPFFLTSPPYPCGVKVGAGSAYFVDIVFTTKWHATVTAEGDAEVVCHYSDKWAWLPLP